MGLIERLREKLIIAREPDIIMFDGPRAVRCKGAVTTKQANRDGDAAAYALENLMGYAAHYDCEEPEGPCTCGLSALLKELTDG